MVLTVAFDYGSRAELMAAVAAARAEGPVTPEAIDAHLYMPELPPVDVMVRTSGELRVSNFLLWQGAGSTIHFTDSAWPDFDAADLDAAIALVDDRRRLDGRRRTVAGHRRARRPRGPARTATDGGGRRRRDRVGRHLVVQAGTGTGKTLAYLVPAILSASEPSSPPPPRRCRTSSPRRTCRSSSNSSPTRVSTLEWAVLKGRINYLCLQRLREFAAPPRSSSSSSRSRTSSAPR